MQRSAGILLPVSSLPSPYGIGCFSQEAYDFVDWLKDAGQTYWQILPLGVTSYGDSPYQSFSAFAGNPYFISLDELVKEGVLTAEECKKAKFGRKADDIDYSQLYKERGRLLRLAYSRSDIGHNEAFLRFCEKNQWWLDDFALFMAVKDRFEGKPWIEWAEDIRLRWQNAMDYYRRELYFEVEYYKYLQFKFDQQWRALKAYANEKGIRIIGEVTPEKVAIVQDADAIWREEIAKAGLDKEISQYYAALTNMHSVGVMGDERTYDYAVALRAVTTTDFMTAESYNMPWDVLGTVTSRIVNEVKHVNRVFYDCTGKPPATIELE